MKGQLLEVKKEVTLKDKLHLMAETLRNCNLERGIFSFYSKDGIDGKEYFCAYGALGFMAGMPKGDLQFNPFVPVLRKYGITESEEETLVEVPSFYQYAEKQMSLCNAIWYMNDHGASFNTTADWLDNLRV